MYLSLHRLSVFLVPHVPNWPFFFFLPVFLFSSHLPSLLSWLFPSVCLYPFSRSSLPSLHPNKPPLYQAYQACFLRASNSAHACQVPQLLPHNAQVTSADNDGWQVIPLGNEPLLHPRVESSRIACETTVGTNN